MKKVPVKEAIGNVLAHDLTKIEPGKFKGARFKKGHKITSEDVDELLKMGKENIFIYHLEDGKLHEDDGALNLSNILKGENDNIDASSPSEGKITLTSKKKGLLKVDKERLKELNSKPGIIAVTCYNNQPVEKDDIIAQTKIVPLVIDETEIMSIKKEVFREKKAPLLDVLSYDELSVSLIVTGSEVYHGRIKDSFSPVVKDKIEKYDSRVSEKIYLPDDKDQIKETVTTQANKHDMVVVTGGMSVDPDDVTPTAIKETGAEVITYGAPLFPGSMLMLAYLGDVPIVGLPGCVMYAATTTFDVFLPRILAREKIKPEEISTMGYGGLCFKCEVCAFPRCGFGQG
ncbi:molybdopterin-binding protein [Natranaerofaba carboxydovora]|uniref:molybdopterin-binding protein n=1 Tax=Natranaerofaba carboxydovora TaxID=2742683 RepID=UPI001F1426A2|nr:molybdopterin-binding protein [Natranaerofaba carboxydovora]UMZ73197.1 Molybdopterin molybdenumtransferase [Natranaerofaba carboxydovora]